MRIQLDHVEPVIWRRLLVPGSVRMAKLADMLIAGMGWSNSHLHAFRVGDARYGMNFDEYPEGEIDEKSVTVLQALRDENWFRFDYDFGDSWEHEVMIENLSWSYFGLKYAVCLEGPMPARPKTWAACRVIPTSSRPSPIRPTRSTTAISIGRAAPSTRPTSTWLTPTPCCRRSADQEAALRGAIRTIRNSSGRRAFLGITATVWAWSVPSSEPKRPEKEERARQKLVHISLSTTSIIPSRWAYRAGMVRTGLDRNSGRPGLGRSWFEPSSAP